jgi:hypothetical protein
MVVMEVVQGADNFPGFVGSQEGFQQILLSPEPDTLREPVLGIVSRAKNVVDVNNYAGFQGRQQFEVLEEKVSLRADQV